ncbi:hypothetical protein CXG81DRAFT_15392 [Caulochytrium protostelioides]|uniref:HCP-like protein n=1 Tax=Caulochytrium protostelioides TaxID=1555241 RepID=A0A4P9X2K3_9FUNG|nr:hypothetical protein CXG81DRAFT_15392 [Caulochytrium protostelioides]|eukprot:RKO98830.1 hypothetical protein CXG81DRAFT_15392 [Caulochytrium protostelioides]
MPQAEQYEAKRKQLLKDGFHLLKKLASGGFADAQYYLGVAYADDQKFDQAFAQFMAAAKRSHAPACHAVGAANEHGRGTKQSNKFAATYYKRAASAGYGPSMYRIGVAMLRGEIGMKVDHKESLKWLKRAVAVADEENPHPLMQLAILYEHGLPPLVPVDESYAVGLLLEAGELGYRPAQYKLGFIYEYGRLGCAPNPQDSIYWYSQAADQGDAEAQFALAGWYLSGVSGLLPKSEAQAFRLTELAADQGLPKAMYALGYFLEMGMGTAYDPQRAWNYYTAAAQRGDTKGQQRVAQGPPIPGLRAQPVRVTPNTFLSGSPSQAMSQGVSVPTMPGLTPLNANGSPALVAAAKLQPKDRRKSFLSIFGGR